MRLVSTALPGVVVGVPTLHADARGWFMESHNAAGFDAALRALGLAPAGPFVQDNQSRSAAGVLRGLQDQLPPHAQGKLVGVLRGAAFDVAVDLRRASPTFGRWVGQTLTADNRHQLWLPPGFAHGVLVLKDETELLYKVTAAHAPGYERAIRWDDPALGIVWPLQGRAPRLSARDAAAPMLAQAEVFG